MSNLRKRVEQLEAEDQQAGPAPAPLLEDEDEAVRRYYARVAEVEAAATHPAPGKSDEELVALYRERIRDFERRGIR